MAGFDGGVGTTERAADAAGDPGLRPRLRVRERPVLPSSRALAGGVLLAVATVGTFVAWRQAVGTPDQSYVVARRNIRPGEVVTADDVRLEAIELPAATADGGFRSVGAVDERVALGPIGQDELVQASQLGEPGSAAERAELAFSLPRDRVLDGRLRSGERVDVYATFDDHTARIAERVEVVAVGDGGGAALSTPTDVTVTLAVPGDISRAELIHALRAGDVTLVRSPATPSSTEDGSTPDDVYRPADAASGGGGGS